MICAMTGDPGGDLTAELVILIGVGGIVCGVFFVLGLAELLVNRLLVNRLVNRLRGARDA